MRGTLIEISIFVVFAIGLLLPFLPGMLELRSRRDDDALRIDQNYARDPRFLGASFRSNIAPLIAANAAGTRLPFLARRNEFARIVTSIEIKDDAQVDDVLLSLGSVTIGRRTSLLDIFAAGTVSIGSESSLRTLAVDGDATIGEGVTVQRWIDGNGNLTVGPHCDLGRSASAAGRVTVGHHTRYKRIFGSPVIAEGTSAAAALELLRGGERAPLVSTGTREVDASTRSLEEGETLESDIIAKGHVWLGARSTVRGSVKSNGDVEIGKGASVIGNVVARGSIRIESDAIVLGHVFAEGGIQLGSGSLVGTSERPKTLSASGKVELAPGASVFGWVISESGGSTVASA